MPVSEHSPRKRRELEGEPPTPDDLETLRRLAALFVKAVSG